MADGIDRNSFDDVVNSLKWNDPYMVLADFVSYRAAQEKVSKLYQKPETWYRMSAVNIANSGYFSADRAIDEYAENIWKLSH